MNQGILDRLNADAKTNDILYFLGDFCIGSTARARDYRRQIRCRRIYFVPGNHDKQTRKLAQEFFWLNDLAQVSVNGRRIILCHYAMRVWEHSAHGSWHLYGHSHRKLLDEPASLSMDVGVDTHDFRPWHLDKISSLLTERARTRMSTTVYSRRGFPNRILVLDPIRAARTAST